MDYTKKPHATKLIIDLMSKEGVIVTENNIKIWSPETMSITDVLRGIQYVQSLGSNILIYANIVPAKEHLEKEHSITILDKQALITLSLKHKMYELFDLLS